MYVDCLDTLIPLTAATHSLLSAHSLQQHHQQVGMVDAVGAGTMRPSVTA